MDVDLLPSQLNTAVHGPGLDISRDKLSVSYKGEGRHDTDVGSIQANRAVPLRRSLYYFELTVVQRGDHGRIAIGFTDKNFKLNKQPGWDAGSYGYHGDDGKKFSGTGKGEEYGPKFTKGDTVGAAYNLAKQEIFFTKNGTRLRTAFRGVKGELFPTVGLHSKGEEVRVNFGQMPFKFDIEALVIEEQAAQAAALERIPVSPSSVHQIVRQYLLHYGYGDTLHAFDAEAGLAAEEAERAGAEGTTDGAAGDGGGGGGDAAERVGGATDDGPCSMAVDHEEEATHDGQAQGAAPRDRRDAVGSSNSDGSASSMCAEAGPPAPGGRWGEGAAAGDGVSAPSSAGGAWGAGGAWRQGDWMRDGALAVRQYVRRSIMSGDVQAAVDCISHTFPKVLQAGPKYEGVRFHLATQQYIELVRSGDVQGAVAFAQSTLAALLKGAAAPPSLSTSASVSAASSSGGAAAAGAGAGAASAGAPVSGPPSLSRATPFTLPSSSSPGSGMALPALAHSAGTSGAGAGAGGGGGGEVLNEAALRDVVALVAYERPEESPLAWLLGQEQRERVADAVNTALLWQACGGGKEAPIKSRMEYLLCQLVAVQDTAFQLNGSQGDSFDLADHLLPGERDDEAMVCN